MRKLAASCVALVALCTALPATALTATQTVEKEIVMQLADGTEKVVRENAEMVTPGDRIVYILNVLNDGEKPASDLVLTMPVPKEVSFMEGSAESPGVKVTYSADGGVTFAKRGAVTITAEDGEEIPASADDISHVRWVVVGPLSVGSEEQLSFKGTLN